MIIAVVFPAGTTVPIVTFKAVNRIISTPCSAVAKRLFHVVRPVTKINQKYDCLISTGFVLGHSHCVGLAGRFLVVPADRLIHISPAFEMEAPANYGNSTRDVDLITVHQSASLNLY